VFSILTPSPGRRGHISGRCKMPKIIAQIPDEIYKNINEEVKLGIFSDTSEAVVSALKKAYARKSRSFLRWLMKKERISEAELLEELGKIRK
jgi:Arc/MetJ-type ribon-helix-helix transcriptional regulator